MSTAPREGAELTLDAAGHASSARFGDMYQPDLDGGQARAVFVAGSGLPARFGGRVAPFRVLELGFGTGTNFVEVWRAWRAAGAPCALEYVGVDAYPLTRDEARRVAAARAAALAAARPGRNPDEDPHEGEVEDTPELGPELTALLAAWPDPLELRPAEWSHAVELHCADGGRAPRLQLVPCSFEHALDTLADAAPGSIDAALLDGFAPSKNPSAWTPAVFARLGTVVMPGGTAATWSVAGVVRRGLAEAGFDVTRQPGYGRKKERLEAVRRR